MKQYFISLNSVHFSVLTARLLLAKVRVSTSFFKVTTSAGKSVATTKSLYNGGPLHYKRLKSNQEFRDTKIARNKERDLEVNAYYIELGWQALRLWEHDIRKNLDKTVDSTLEFVQAAMRRYKKSDWWNNEKFLYKLKDFKDTY